MKKTLLMVSTDEGLERELRTRLPAQTYEIFCAGNLREAMGRLKVSSIDLLLLDLDTPTSDGWTALYDLNPVPRVIGLTERSDLGAQIFFGPHLIGLAQKPINIRNLLSAIEEMLTQKPGLTGLRYVLARTADFGQKVSYQRAAPVVSSSAHRRWGINE